MQVKGFGDSIKFSKGKPILGCGTDLWYTMLQLCLCNYGGRESVRASEELARLLNIEITEVEKKAHDVAKKKREVDEVSAASKIDNCPQSRKG